MPQLSSLLERIGLKKKKPNDKSGVSPFVFHQKALSMRSNNYQVKYYAQKLGYLVSDLSELWQNDVQTSFIEGFEELKGHMTEFYELVDEYATLLETAAHELEVNTASIDKPSIFASKEDGPVTITLSDIPYLRRARFNMNAPDPWFLRTQEGVSTVVVESRKNPDYMYNVFSDHIELVKYIGYFKAVAIPEEIDGLPVTHIGQNCFSLACQVKITSVKIPETITTVLSGAFRGCRAIKSLELPSSLLYIGNYAFSFLMGLETLQIPENVIAMGFGAFRNCMNLLSVKIPENTLRIGSDAFYRCKELRTVEISNSVTDIEGWAFRMCDNLESVTIGSNVVNIGDSVFYECVCLQKVDVPDSVEKIGDKTFYSRRGILLEGAGGSYTEQYAKDNKLKFRPIR